MNDDVNIISFGEIFEQTDSNFTLYFNYHLKLMALLCRKPRKTGFLTIAENMFSKQDNSPRGLNLQKEC